VKKQGMICAHNVNVGFDVSWRASSHVLKINSLLLPTCARAFARRGAEIATDVASELVAQMLIHRRLNLQTQSAERLFSYGTVLSRNDERKGSASLSIQLQRFTADEVEAMVKAWKLTPTSPGAQ
jgi:hypothetical protein